jgi:hypothetical protein
MPVTTIHGTRTLWYLSTGSYIDTGQLRPKTVQSHTPGVT